MSPILESVFRKAGYSNAESIPQGLFDIVEFAFENFEFQNSTLQKSYRRTLDVSLKIACQSGVDDKTIISALKNFINRTKVNPNWAQTVFLEVSQIILDAALVKISKKPTRFPIATVSDLA